jgi:hypothetical protein
MILSWSRVGLEPRAYTIYPDWMTGNAVRQASPPNISRADTADIVDYCGNIGTYKPFK